MRLRKPKRGGSWVLDFRDHRQRRQRLAMFRDKRSSEGAAERVQDLVRLRLAGKDLDAHLSSWIEGIPPKLLRRLVGMDLIPVGRATATQTLDQHVDAFRSHLVTRGVTDKHIETTVSRIGKVIAGCGWRRWSDCDGGQVNEFLKGLPVSARTRNYYRATLIQFARWMRKSGRATGNPFEVLSRENVAPDRRHVRRALQPDEIRRLLAATRAAETRYGLTGAERALLYETALQTGLRASELRSLTVADLDFRDLTLTVRAAYSKHRREDVQPLRRDLAAKLAEYVSGRDASAQVFNVPASFLTARMIRPDLSAAGIPYRDDAGRVADFHSLRVTFITTLVRSGASVKECQTLARHSNPALTLNTYTDLRLNDVRGVVDRLPRLGYDDEQQRRTQAG